jgi:ABC-type lipoprotein release transport system permease subunit
MAAGRSFSRQFADSNAVVLNEAAVRIMGLRNPVGKRITVWGQRKTIVGITRDFHFNSLHETILPFIFKLEPQSCMLFMIRVKNDRQKHALDAIKSYYKEVNPGTYFEYRFLDDDYRQQYKTEMLIATLCKYFAAFTILISCLGLFGLVTVGVGQREREIAIRRTLGSSRRAIVFLLSVDFAKVIAVSILIGLPVSYIIARKWLNDFAYRIRLTPAYFVVGAILIFGIAALTIGIRSIKASRTKPIESLRNPT